MKRLFFSLLFLSLSLGIGNAQGVAQAEELEAPPPELEVRLGPGTLPSQRVYPNDKSVELIRVWFTASNHPNEPITLKKLLFLHEGDDRDHFVRYTLVQSNKVLGRVALVDSEVISFSNLNVILADGKTVELRLLADISTGEIVGRHSFSLPYPEFIALKKGDFRDPETLIKGEFPIEANKIIISSEHDSPPPECNLREDPVCGEDGRTYYNLCIPFHKGVEIAHEGSCYQAAVEKPKPCPEEVDPVCGEDGLTYPNQCFLDLLEDVSRRHPGPCFPNPYTGPPKDFHRAVELYDIKHREMLSLRPRISEDAEQRLARISATLHQYPFTEKTRLQAIEHMHNFLLFTQIPSDRLRLEQQVELLNSEIALAKARSAKEKYAEGRIPFVDVDEDDWFFSHVKFLTHQGWSEGYRDEAGNPTGLYHPEEVVTKAEATKLAFLAAGFFWDENATPQNPLAKNHWASGIVSLAEDLDLTLWKDEPNPNKKTDRGEIVRLILEVFEITPPRYFPRSTFSDVSKYTADFRYIEYAQRLGIIAGYPDGTFQAESSVLRAEIAKMIEKAFVLFR